jgi:hypothetical protein
MWWRAKIAFIFLADEDKSLLLCWNVTRKEPVSRPQACV